MSFLACIGVFWDAKFMLLAYSIAGITMGIVLTQSAVASSMLLSAHVPPLIMTTNRICRNVEEAMDHFGCPPVSVYRRLEDRSFSQQFRFARAALTGPSE